MQSVYNPNDTRQVQTVVNQLVSQFEGNTGSIALANSATSTTVQNAKCRSTSKVFLQARNAAAVSASAYVSAISNGSFTVSHPSGTTVRNFDYVLFDI